MPYISGEFIENLKRVPKNISGIIAGTKRLLAVGIFDKDGNQINFDEIKVEESVLSASPKESQVTVNTSATPLPATPLTGRNSVYIRNASLQNVNICSHDAVYTAGSLSAGSIGLTLEPGDARTYRVKDETVILYAITLSGTAVLEVEEGK